jgi:hypothetical protein
MKKKQTSENYLERRPMRAEGIGWNTDENGLITLEIENTGVMNRIAQKLFKKPKISYVHMEEVGSFVWPLLDGEKDILVLGEAVKEQFGEKAEPLYPRLAKYFQIMDSYHFIQWK